MKVTRTIVETRAALADLPRPLGLVPTMGALHDGHLALMHASTQRCAGVVASLFVNPTQFGPGEDYLHYPRAERHDLELFEKAGADVVFAPAPDELYPRGFATLVHVGGPLTDTLEGASRTSHFDGVATIVAKLLTIATPDVAFFGQKDAQQLAVIRRLVTDLGLPVEIAAVETVREGDGLALSSRNSYLSPAERTMAPRLHEALLAGRETARRGGSPPEVVAAVNSALEAGPGAAADKVAGAALEGGPGRPAGAAGAPRFAVDYVAVVDPATFVPETAIGARSLIVAAARLGSTRLIDNLPALTLRGQTGQSTHESVTGLVPGTNTKEG